jgi:hypothetical protein
LSIAAPPFPPASTRVRHPERVAWGVMLIAFAVFCLSCVLSVVAVHGFFFLSTVPMLSSVQVARGTIGLTGSDLREEAVYFENRDIQIGNIVRPTPQSQALLVFRDPYNENRIFAMITLDEAISSAALQLATRPRFEWGNAGYQITLTNVEGNVEVYIPDGIDNNLNIYLRTTQGSEVRISGSGQHTIRALDEVVRATNHRGRVLLINPELPREQSAKDIPPDHQGIAQTNLSEIMVVSHGYDELLTNSRFEQTVAPTRPNEAESVFLPEVWRCGPSRASTPPSAKISTAQEYGRKALFLVRGEGAVTHGATYCEQGAPSEDENREWMPVSQYDYLALETTFYINYQSLNRCGSDGSECPLMLRVNYVDVQGNNQSLIYGFYTVNTPVDIGYPFICDSCRQEHIFIREKTWYTFSTGNLLNTLPLEQRPDYITSVQFYASGHQYDTRVSEVSLIGGYLDQMSPTMRIEG